MRKFYAPLPANVLENIELPLVTEGPEGRPQIVRDWLLSALQGTVCLDEPKLVDAGIEAALSLMNNAEPDVRLAATFLLRQFDDGRVPDAIRRRLVDGSPAVRLAALAAVSYRCDYQSTGMVRTLRRDASVEVRRYAKEVLRTLSRDECASPVLIRNENMRTHAQ